MFTTNGFENTSYGISCYMTVAFNSNGFPLFQLHDKNTLRVYRMCFCNDYYIIFFKSCFISS